jgi:hypothetical protein
MQAYCWCGGLVVVSEDVAALSRANQEPVEVGVVEDEEEDEYEEEEEEGEHCWYHTHPMPHHTGRGSAWAA